MGVFLGGRGIPFGPYSRTALNLWTTFFGFSFFTFGGDGHFFGSMRCSSETTGIGIFLRNSSCFCLSGGGFRVLSIW